MRPIWKSTTPVWPLAVAEKRLISHPLEVRAVAVLSVVCWKSKSRAFTPTEGHTILSDCTGHEATGPDLWETIMSDLLQELEQEHLRDDLPDFAPGDTVRVLYRVREGSKERIQAFEGVCIARRGGGTGATFTIRKISGGIGVERIFPVHAPTVKGVEVMRRGRVRRAKLYYLRNLRGKAARIPERRS